MDIKEQVLQVMKEAGKPVSAGEVEKLSGLDRKDIDKAFQALKKKKQSFLLLVVNGNLPVKNSLNKQIAAIHSQLLLCFIRCQNMIHPVK